MPFDYHVAKEGSPRGVTIWAEKNNWEASWKLGPRSRTVHSVVHDAKEMTHEIDDKK